MPILDDDKVDFLIVEDHRHGGHLAGLQVQAVHIVGVVVLVVVEHRDSIAQQDASHWLIQLDGGVGQLVGTVIEDVDLGLSLYKENVAAGASEGFSLLILSPGINVRRGGSMLEAEFLMAKTEGDDSKIDNTTKAAYVLAARDVGNWDPFRQI